MSSVSLLYVISEPHSSVGPYRNSLVRITLESSGLNQSTIELSTPLVCDLFYTIEDLPCCLLSSILVHSLT